MYIDTSALEGAAALAAASSKLAIYYEHPRWFDRLFAELDRRGISYEKHHVEHQVFDPAAGKPDVDLVFNRMSPSAYLRGGVQGMFFTLGYLDHLERLGVPVVNGSKGFAIEISKARQLTLLESLGLPGGSLQDALAEFDPSRLPKEPWVWITPQA